MGRIKNFLNNKKNVLEKMIIVLVIGVVFMIVGDFSVSENKDSVNKEIICEENIDKSSNSIEKDMEEILSKIDGAGEVKVMITYKTSKEVVHQLEKKETINDAKEDDGKVTKQREFLDSVVFEESNGSKKAVVKKEIEPIIKGVVVVARGALDDNVKLNLQMATKVLMDIPIHKISVFAMKK